MHKVIALFNILITAEPFTYTFVCITLSSIYPYAENILFSEQTRMLIVIYKSSKLIRSSKRKNIRSNTEWP